MAQPADVSRRGLGADACPGAGGRRLGAVRRIGALLLVGIGVGACSIPFGPGSGDPSVGTEDARRERNQRYQQEQQLMERQRQFDRIGPSDR